MKKLLFLTLTLLPILVGCSKGDGFSPNKFDYDANLLYGTWSADSYYDGRQKQTHRSNITLTFSNNGAFKGTGHIDFYLETKYRLAGDYIHLEYCTMSVGKLTDGEMRVYWWLGDRISDMQHATFTKSKN